MGHFKPLTPKPNFDALEQGILAFWQQERIFARSLQGRAEAPEFIFFEGPPTANGKPGVHHVLTRTFKDLVCRYQTMRGKRVERRAGWDEHGLPVEIAVQKELGITGKAEIEADMARFNALCAQSTQKYIEDWEKLTERMGYWVDFPSAYRTSDPVYIERVWGVLKRLHEKELLYKGEKIVPWACDSGTVVSQAEVALGYKDVIDESLYVKFKLHLTPESKLRTLDPKLAGGIPVYMLAWTTTPWTLPSNMFLAINPEIVYVIAHSESQKEALILSEKRVSALCADGWQVLAKLTGQELLEQKLTYQSLFYDRAQRLVCGGKLGERESYYVLDEAEIGTGIVHTAPAFGEDDLNAWRWNGDGEEILATVTPEGLFNENAPESLSGQSLFNKAKDGQLEFKRINRIIAKQLQERGLVHSIFAYEHAYPHNWRTGNPLIYYLRPSWYVRTQALKASLLAANQSVNWFPAHIKAGRFGKWLENNVDWAISRERFWGTPMPIWQGDKGSLRVFGSYAELEAASGLAVPTDPHRPQIDDLVWTSSTGEVFRRIPEVIDCWFDSGAMPIASYDLADPADFPQADFICEAVDQTRGWFYTMLALATGLRGEAPYKNVLCLGHILDGEGQKMSKSKGNVLDPWALFAQHGCDAVRWFMVSACSAGNPIRFEPAGVAEVLKRFIIPFWNSYAFFVLYANLDEVNPNGLEADWDEDLQPIDKWILAELTDLRSTVTEAFASYEFARGTAAIERFVESLSNVWVRANRYRFWNAQAAQYDKGAYFTLRQALLELAQLVAPVMPFFGELLYTNLRSDNMPLSVHLTDWEEKLEPFCSDPELVSELGALQAEMTIALEVLNIARNQRQASGLKIRQPLASLRLPSSYKISSFHSFLARELNVKRVFQPTGQAEIELETTLSQELIDEGLAREFIHALQSQRKQAGLEVSDRIELVYSCSDPELQAALQTHAEHIAGELLAVKLQSVDSLEEGEKLRFNGKELLVKLAKSAPFVPA